jgi:hypothetical protein
MSWARAYALSLLAMVLAACPANEPPPNEGCANCHAGIEQAHAAIQPGQCTLCHGGDGAASTKEAAHVIAPADWAEIRGTGLPPAPFGFIKDFAPDQLAKLPTAYLRFINPGDIRVVGETCGSCHPEQARNMPTSVMTTNAGHYWPSLWLADLQADRIATFSSYPVTDPNCDPSIPGTVCALGVLAPPAASEISAVLTNTASTVVDIERLATQHYLAKNCNTCHQAGYPRNDSPGLYRSTGCSACHVLYDKEGVYRGEDQALPRGVPVYPARHVITKAIPTEQCATCHFQGGRIGLLYRGIREGGFSTRPPNAEVIAETLNGRAPGFYLTDEDTTNTYDETPPDVHFTRGLHCADCHVGSDVHGTGRIYSTAKQQIDLVCEDCHGSVRQPQSPNPAGQLLTRRGRVLPQLRAEGGKIILRGIDGADHLVRQVATILATEATSDMRAAMATDDRDWSHTDALTCDTCHSSYVQYCIGCHVSFDLRLDQVDYQTGLKTPGLTRGGRTSYALDKLLLGTAPDGRVQTAHPSQQLQMSVFNASTYGGEDGALLMGGVVSDGAGNRKTWGRFRRRGSLKANNGFVPFFQHTTSKAGRSCEACHRRDTSPAELARVRGVYGYGTGDFLLTGSEGERVDGLQFLDPDGNPTTTWVHDGSGPVAPDRRARALDVVLE